MRRFAVLCRWSALFAMVTALTITPHSTLHAQSFYGSIVGTVTDTSGAIIPGATVTVTNKSTDEKHVATSNSAGEYAFVNLVPATYTVAVERANFKRYLRDTVTLEVDSTVRVDAALQVGEVTETVEVATETSIMQTESGTLSNKVEGQQVQEMPLNGRNVMNLLELVPGVIPSNAQELQTGMNQGGTGTNPGGWNGFTTNGGDNEEYMDGAPLNVLQGGNLTLVPTQDATQEFNVDTSANSADQGRATGAIINMTSKTGTNQWHGSAYEYIRNRDFNANTFFNNQGGIGRPEWTQNQYGLNIGLPIKKDKMFFFGSWEVFDIKTAISTTETVPTAAEQAGVFYHSIHDPFAPADGCVITQNAVAGTWTLGAGCLDPSSAVFKTMWPACTLCTVPTTATGVQANNYPVNEPDGDHQNQMNIRYDWNINPKNRLFVHEAWWHIQDVPARYFPTDTQWNAGQEAATFNNNLVILGDTYTISPKTVADVRATYLRFFFGAFSDPFISNYGQFDGNSGLGAWAQIGKLVPKGNNWLPYATPSGSDGITAIQNNEGMTQHFDTYGINASVTRIAGKHNLKVGGEARLMDLEVGVTQFATGNTTYNAFYSGDEWSDFLLGYPKSGTLGGGFGGTNFGYYQGYYVQDTWQATRKLTLNLGLRYELPGGESEKKNAAVVLQPNLVDQYTGIKGTEVLVASSAYPARTVTNVRHNLFDPRVGFAYRLDDKTVVRGGYGIINQAVDLDAGGSGPAGANVNGVADTFTANSANTLVVHQDNPFPGAQLPVYKRGNPAFMQSIMLLNPTGYSVSSYLPTIAYPYVQEWNFTVARTVGSTFQASVSYVGTHGVHLKAGGGEDEIPASAYTVSGTGPTQTAVAASGPYAGMSLTAKVPGTVGNGCTALGTTCNWATPSGTVAMTGWLVGQTLQPYPYYKNFTVSNLTYGNQHYNAMQVQVSKRFRPAGEVGSALTWAKTIGDTGGQQDEYNHRADRAVSGIPSRLVVNYVYPLPFGDGQRFANFSNGAASRFVSGWAFNGITSFQHGGYLGITMNNGGTNQSLLAQDFGALGSRANYTPGCSKNIGGSAVSKINEWFNTSCFTNPGLFTYGNAPQSDPHMFGQGQDNWDIAMLKTTKISEKATFQFRAETFNTFNRMQFNNPTTTLGAATFGQLPHSQANNPRLIQLSGRVSF